MVFEALEIARGTRGVHYCSSFANTGISQNGRLQKFQRPQTNLYNPSQPSACAV
jgi:hypothetical protein